MEGKNAESSAEDGGLASEVPVSRETLLEDPLYIFIKNLCYWLAGADKLVMNRRQEALK